MAFVCQRMPYINIASRNLYAQVGEFQNRPFEWNKEHEISFERAKPAMNTTF